jgi:Protein of unknown function (DUF2568)
VSALNLAIRFVCEVAAVVALVWWGWALAGIGAGIVVVVIWGLFIAPRSWNRLSDPYRLGAELIIFGFATAGYWEVGRHVLAIVFAVAAVVSALLVRRWPEPVEGP